MLSMNIIERLTPRSERVSRRRDVAKSFKAKADAKRTLAERFADWMTAKFGSMFFLAFNACLFLGWIVINVGWVPAVKPFDPFPFELLTTAVSLEAIFLAVIVLISQNRESRIADVREEIDLQINMMAEEEVSKIIELLVKSLHKQGVDVSGDQEIQQMLKPRSGVEIQRKLEKELNSD